MGHKLTSSDPSLEPAVPSKSAVVVRLLDTPDGQEACREYHGRKDDFEKRAVLDEKTDSNCEGEEGREGEIEHRHGRWAPGESEDALEDDGGA